MNKENKEKNDKKGEGMITFQNWCIKNNTTQMDIVGLQTHLKIKDKQEQFKEKELDKSFKTYLKQPAFIK